MPLLDSGGISCQRDGDLVARVAHHIQCQLERFGLGEVGAHPGRHLWRDIGRCPDQRVNVPQRCLVPVGHPSDVS